MADTIIINKNNSEEEIYKEILPQIKSLINPEEPIICSLSNITAALKETFEKISWVGFYILKNETLFLGPFQGKIACTIIKLGSGVCGTSAKNKETIIVEAVDKFPGHIACDAGSKSEIVIPILQNDKLFGVLDIDSYKYTAFNEVDKKYLENLVNYICETLPLNNYLLS